jgi:hypothetical protein
MVRAAMTAVQGGRAGRQRQTAGWLRERVVVVEAECQAVRAERDQLAGQVERLTGETRRLQARVRELEAKVEELRRAGKRQAAPFSKDRPSPHPGRPGRKPGAAYGQQGGDRCPSGSTGWWRWDCRRPARTVAVRLGWSGSPASGRRTCPWTARPRSAAMR